MVVIREKSPEIRGFSRQPARQRDNNRGCNGLSFSEIHVTTVFDGELDATDVFVSLISQKYGKTNAKEYLAKKKDIGYNEDEVQKSQIPSGLCG